MVGLQEMALAMPQMCCALYLQALGHPRQVSSPQHEHSLGQQSGFMVGFYGFVGCFDFQSLHNVPDSLLLVYSDCSL